MTDVPCRRQSPSPSRPAGGMATIPNPSVDRSESGGRAGTSPPNGIPSSRIPAVNVASVPQLSPLRYPGGKTWLIPHVRAWLHRTHPGPDLLLEPFCGGGIISLSAVMEGWVGRCCMSELDRDVAAFWHAALGHGPALAERVLHFECSRASVHSLASHPPRDVLEHGFRTLVLNRTRRGGVLAPGAALTRTGDNGRGVASRWYPETIASRLRALAAHVGQIDFVEGDGMALLEARLGSSDRKVAVFVDPPYTAGGKRAGRRLYTHHEIDHERLFALLEEREADFLMTWDEAPEIVSLIHRHGFHAVRVVMKNGHHHQVPELVITPQPVFA